MKKTTRNYIWILTANFLLLAAVMGIWEYRLRAVDAARPDYDPGLIYGAELARPDGNGDYPFYRFEVPGRLPDLVFLRDLETRTSLRDLRGQWTVLNFWASWCAPCLEEMPTLQALSDAYKNKDMQVVAVSIDEAESATDIADMIKEMKFGSVARHWDVSDKFYETLQFPALPFTMILNPDGQVYGAVVGPRDWSSPETMAHLDAVRDGAETPTAWTLVPAQTEKP